MGWSLALRRRQEPILLGVAGALLAVVALVPLAVLGSELFTADALRHTAQALSAPRTWLLFGGSVGIAAAVTAMALALGLPLGLILARSDLAWRGIALWLHTFPVFVPPFLVALGWFHVFGRSGLLGTDATARALFSRLGVVVIMGMALTPIVTALVAVALQAVDPALEEAAMLVADPRRVATRILLPLIRPAIALAALVVFSLAFSELGVPMFLRVNVYPAMVFARLGGVVYAPGEAFALGLPLFGVATALLAFERRAAGRRSFAQGSEHLEEAAAMTGARFLRRLGRILLPVHARGIAAAWLLTVVFCLRDLETAVLLYPAGQEPLTVRIFTLEANGPQAIVAALSCVRVGVTAAVVAAGSALLLWRRA